MNTNETAFYGDNWLNAKPTYITNMEKCKPNTALDHEFKPKRWRMLPYETDSLSGVLLIAGAETIAQTIAFPLEVSGWHAVSIGAWKLKDWYLSGADSHKLLLKLSSEQTFSVMDLPRLHEPTQRLIEWDRWTRGEELEENFWKIADLTDQELVLGQEAQRVAPGDSPGSIKCSPATIAYIKLVPLSESEVASWKSDFQRKDTRRLFAHNDFTIPSTEEEIRRQIEPFRNSDYSRMYYEGAMGDVRHYLNNHAGKIPTFEDVGDFFSVHSRKEAEDWQKWKERDVDPFQVMLDHTHEIGLEFHACYRVSGFHFPPPLDHYDLGYSLYNEHPELRGVDRNGVLTPRLAYSYPETRKYVISVLLEMANYDIDGICIMYNRRIPLVEYEPPVVEGFKAEYGLDPRQLDESDHRWLSYRARILTQFMREVREAMDKKTKDNGKSRQLEITAIVMSSEEENLINGIDAKAWVEEELVDTLVPYTSEPNMNHVDEAWTDVSKIDYFLSITRGTSCILAPNMQPPTFTAEGYLHRANSLYRKGIDSLFFWWGDVGNANYKNSWNTLRRLGHREEIEAWVNNGKPNLDAPLLTVNKLGDWDMSYITPG